jgi:hypothetical protein
MEREDEATVAVAAPPAASAAPAEPGHDARPARGERPARLPLRRVAIVSAVVLAALAAGARLATPSSSSADRDPVGSGITVAGRLATRPGINGSSRPPLDPPAQRAVDALAATSVLGTGHTHVGSNHLFGPAAEVALDAADEQRFEAQWQAATAAVPGLDTTADAAAAGYVLSSTPAPGVGVHWVNWTLVARPFDPARPAMLLFSRVRGEDRLVGFSYWVQQPQAPDGFAGPNDQWHTHNGLCVVNGWVEREEVPSANACVGSWLAAGDLWMLHAWVVPDYANRWGRFAQANPMLCPSGQVPDLASCTPDAG